MSKESINLISRGKINWWLRVRPVRPDGYHELETVFQELELGEQISVTRTPNNTCKLIGFPPDIPPESNLVTKSWETMKSRFDKQIHGVDFHIRKSLPHGGGIGGGSSNAACAIKAINELYELHLTIPTMQEIAAEIGSDVPFFIQGGTAIGRGRGEILEQLPTFPRYWLVLMMPSERMATPAAYKALDSIHRPQSTIEDESHDLSTFLTKLKKGDPAELAGLIRNDFELIANEMPWFRECKKALTDAGALKIFLCGSGSTVAGLVSDKETAIRIAHQINGTFTSTRV